MFGKKFGLILSVVLVVWCFYGFMIGCKTHNSFSATVNGICFLVNLGCLKYWIKQ